MQWFCPQRYFCNNLSARATLGVGASGSCRAAIGAATFSAISSLLKAPPCRLWVNHTFQESQIDPWPRYFWKVSRYTKSPPERAPGDKFISLPWRMWWSFRNLRGWQILSLIFLGFKRKKICHQKSTGFFTRLGGLKNPKFHHLDLLGPPSLKVSRYTSHS